MPTSIWGVRKSFSGENQHPGVAAAPVVTATKTAPYPQGFFFTTGNNLAESSPFIAPQPNCSAVLTCENQGYF